MKKLVLFLLSFAVITYALSAGITAAFHTDIHNTVLGVALFQAALSFVTYFNIIQMPKGVLGEYIGAPTSEGAGVQVINSERERGAYMAYATKPEFAGKDISPSFLRLEVDITNSNNKLTFKTYVGDGTTQNPTEKRLDRNDKFIITKIGLFLLMQLPAKSNGRLHAYPNLTDFGAAAAADLESIFNGELSITINRKKWLPSLDTQRFLKIPETQQSAGTNRDQRSLHHLMENLTPHIELDGSGTNEIEITYPSHAAWAGATPVVGGNTHRAVLYIHGLLIVSGSSNG